VIVPDVDTEFVTVFDCGDFMREGFLGVNWSEFGFETFYPYLEKMNLVCSDKIGYTFH
jgi:hypothetical protein